MNSLLIASGILFYIFVSCIGMRNWNYELLFVTFESSDDNLANGSVRLDRGTLGVQTFSAVLDWKFDVDENTMAEMDVLFCQSGREEDYHAAQMFKISNTTFYDFLNKNYMQMCYSEFESCSNLPAIDVPFVPPWNKTTYVFNKCLPSGDSFIEVVPTGYYKVLFKIIAQVELNLNITVKLTPRFL